MIYQLLPLEDLAVGQARRVDVSGIAVVVTRPSETEVYALRDTCPHAGARLSNGELLRTIHAGAGGGYELSEQFALFCPWHGYEFDVATGRCLADPRARVKTYKTEIVDGVITMER